MAMERIYTEDDLTGLVLRKDTICKKCKKSFSSDANVCKNDIDDRNEIIKFAMCPHCQELNGIFRLFVGK